MLKHRLKEEAIDKTVEKLIKKYPSEAERISACVRRAATLWNTRADGTAADFRRFCCDNFLIGPDLENLLASFEKKLESANGHFTALLLKLRREVDEDTGPLGPADRLFASYSPGAHFIEDMFKTRLAFLALLNFPVQTLEACLEQGPAWSRDEWARARLAQRFAHRVPSEINGELAAAYSQAEQYINSYNIYLRSVTGPDGEELFPKGVKLISHWGLRDYLKGLYSEKTDGLKKQRVIQAVMERIITQEIPEKAINSEKHAWDPAANTLDGAKAAREPDTRYERFLEIFRAHLKEDQYYPAEPTHMDRKFKLGREIPEPEVEAMFAGLLEAKEVEEAAALIAARLDRPLEPFDIWYDGFKARSGVSQAELDRVVAARYPDTAAFQKGIPEILQKLGFSKETARFVADRVEVNAARGAGHAWGPGMRTEKAHLRTRVPKGGMDYQGFNVAMHELGHCTEQVFSLYKVDHTLLEGVPNTAFTEGFAFVFQDRDLEVLGIGKPDEETAHMKTLDAFWSAREIAGVALVDMNVWRWLYKNKDAEAADLRQAVSEIAKSVWDRYYAPVFGAKGSALLGVYSHMINHALYLPDYPLGHIIAFQIEEYFKEHNLADEMERMCVQGAITPREWMKRAVGADISAEPMIKAAGRALKALKEAVKK
ncbi:MAG: hypothetical protein A2081_03985 [Elusimicrobia bacterium GWC2_61_19]|nr:MAG: hypothetical protein A2081_03985 [Elusimicrobia bacterium GWC2_61_19]